MEEIKRLCVDWYKLFTSAPYKSLLFCCTSDTTAKICCQEDKFHNVEKPILELLIMYITEEVTDWSQIRIKIKHFFSQAPP